VLQEAEHMVDEMSGFQGIIPAELVEAVRAKRCILFVGSGLSAQVRRSNGMGLPTWAQFLGELLDWAIARQVRFWGDPEDIRSMVAKNDLLAAAQELQDRVGTPALGEFLAYVFRDRNVVPATAHRILPKLPFRAILTTNYDSLIEGAYSMENGGMIPPVLTQEDLFFRPSPLRGSEFFIFKIHGHLDRPNSIVLGSRDYQDLLFRTPGYRQFLETLFATHAVLFLGFGGADPNLDNVLDRLASIYSRTLDRHFILLPAGRLNATAKRRLALDRRLEAVEYFVDQEHSQIVAFLQEMVAQISRGTTDVGRASADGTSLRVFISHSVQDAAVVTKVVAFLREAGYAPWTATDELLPGDDIRQRISEAIAAADAFIVVFSEKSIKSPWVEYETQAAIVREVDRRTVVVPIVLDDVMPPVFLLDRLFLRLNRNFKPAALEPLLRTLERIRAERKSG
jgi:hypothetical protein